LLALSEVAQPEEDIHEWIRTNVFGGKLSREESKKKTFAWLYNPEAKNGKLERIFNKEKIINKYWKNGIVSTPFKRNIKADAAHALNYLIQSTSSDLFLRQMIKVFDFLKDEKSHIAFCMHDSLIIDLHTQEKQKLPEIKRIFSNTGFGEFKANASAGLQYGTMKKMDF
jgi:DNA polymerase I-like protein with 3'-5' exonuclease and polymerase domains